ACAHREKLSDSEFLDVLEAITGKSCKAAKREIAARYPNSVELPPDRINPINAEYSEVTFVANQELLEKIYEIQGLLAHTRSQVTIREMMDVMISDYYERYHPEAKAKRAEEREAKRKQNEGFE